MSRHKLHSTRFPVNKQAHWFEDGTILSRRLYPPVHPAGFLRVLTLAHGRETPRSAWSARAALLVRFAQHHPLTARKLMEEDDGPRTV